MFFKNIKKYLDNIENLSFTNKKKFQKNLVFGTEGSTRLERR